MIYVLCGNIACGKTTYATKRAKKGAIIVSDDSIVNSLHIQNTLYQKKLKPLYKKIENEIIKYCLENKIDVVIDRRNHKRKTRLRYIEWCKEYKTKCTYVVFPKQDPVILAKRRFEKDSRGWSLEDWIKVAQRTEDEFECVHPYEGYDELIYQS